MNRPTKLFLLGSLIALTACNGPESPLKPYVEQSNALQAVNATTLTGKVEFTRTYTYTAYETQCDNVLVGYQTRHACSYRTVCSEGLANNLVSPVDNLAANASDRGRGGWNRNHEAGRSAPDRGHDGDRHDGHPYPIGRPEPVRHCYQVLAGCRTWQVPIYQSENCRNVPVERVATENVDSPVTVHLTGATSTKDIQLAIGVKTNQKFQEAIANPAARPGKLGYLFNNLTRDDNTLLVLKSKSYVLTPGQNFLQLPSNFKQGDPIVLNVDVQPESNRDQFSAVGTPVDLPALNY